MRQLNPVIARESSRFGLSAGAEAAFVQAARHGAPAFAEAWIAAQRVAWSAAAPEAWPPRWPPAWTAPSSAVAGRRLALAALFDLDPKLAAGARWLFTLGRVSWGGPSAARALPHDPPQVRAPLPTDAERASLLAHELAHGVQMLDGPFRSRPAPPLAAAEILAHAAERFVHIRLARQNVEAAFACTLDLGAAMLLRHPARAAHASGESWREACARFAPGLGWERAPPRGDVAGRLLAYGAGAALGLLAAEQIARSDARIRRCWRDWIAAGPSATVSEAAALLGGADDDPALYRSAYGLLRRLAAAIG